MQQSPIGRLMIQANFGRTALNRPALLFANHYRLIVALLVGALFLFHLPLTNPIILSVGACVIFIVYAIARWPFLPHLNDRFYTSHVQFWRAQAGIISVTTLLTLLGLNGGSGALWVLYLLPMLMISYYCESQRTYLGVAIEVAALAVGVHLIELWQHDIPIPRLIGELGARLCALLLVSFLVHYLARVDVIARRGATIRDKIVQMLLEQAIFETDGLALWSAIREACSTAVGATKSELYLYDHGRGQLQLIESMPDQMALGKAIPLTEDDIAVCAARSGVIVEQAGVPPLVRVAAPIYGQPDHEGNPLAVVVLQLKIGRAYERRAVHQFLNDLLDHIWPVCTHASIRQQFPLLDRIDNRDVHRLRLNDVLDVVLETLCHKLGFAFATISLVNEDTREIGTVRGKNVPAGWVAEAHHPLDSHDIQADVLRTGKIEVIGEWDPRFDEQIWTRYNHSQLLRVWVPLGHGGTIEAGFYKNQKSEIPRLLIEMLKGYARDVTVAIQNAEYYEREQRHAALMAQLHRISYDLQTNPQQHDEAALLQHITDSALDLLGASIILLYPFNRRDGQFARPILVGHIEGRLPLMQPNDHDNIVRYIADTRVAYYQPDAQCDRRLVNAELAPQMQQRHRTFTVRQNILSFAGVPLLAGGKLLGVLCVNYRERHQFSPHDRQVIELFAQQAAAVILSGELIREQERRRLEYDLHDSVKSSVRGLILFSRAATDSLESDPCRSRKHLHEVRRIAWGILGDVDMILKDLAPNGYDGQELNRYIREELRRLVGRDWSKLDLDLDDHLPALPMAITRTLLYLMREAMINALEHAQAQTVQVSIRPVGECVQIVVSDNGCGFIPNVEDSEDHRGLVIMRERVKMIGGRLEVRSTLGGGTTIWGELPQKEAVNDSG